LFNIVAPLRVMVGAVGNVFPLTVLVLVSPLEGPYPEIVGIALTIAE